MKKLIFLLAVSLLSQTIVAQKEAYFKHEPNGDGVFFSGTMKYFPNVKGGLEFRVIISDINIEAISFEGKKYDTRYFKAPNKEDIKGTIYFSGKAYHGYDFRQTWFNNCGITIELSKNTTTANMLQDNGSAYFSEAITDNYFENKTAFEVSVKSDVEGGGANWVKYDGEFTYHMPLFDNPPTSEELITQLEKELKKSYPNEQFTINHHTHLSDMHSFRIYANESLFLKLKEKAKQWQSFAPKLYLFLKSKS